MNSQKSPFLYIYNKTNGEKIVICSGKEAIHLSTIVHFEMKKKMRREMFKDLFKIQSISERTKFNMAFYVQNSNEISH